MNADNPPPEVAELLARRSEARAARDWAQADALRDRIHELGWEPIDSPSGSTARPAPGRGADVGSRLDEPSSRAAS
ncbi:MAG TPA: hypothetical protein VF013_05060, partial [Candidatus Limnocylindria bacterium]